MGPGRGCHPCPGITSGAGMLEPHCHHLLLSHKDTGHCHSPAGMSLLPLSGHPGTGYHWSLARGSTRPWNSGTGHLQVSASWHWAPPGSGSQGIPLQQVSAPWTDGADVALRQQREGSRARPGVPEQNSLQEPPPSLLKTPHPSLRSGAPPWPGCALQHRDSDAINELEGL